MNNYIKFKTEFRDELKELRYKIMDTAFCRGFVVGILVMLVVVCWIYPACRVLIRGNSLSWFWLYCISIPISTAAIYIIDDIS